MTAPLHKGFIRSHLEWAFGVTFTAEGVRVPYFNADGSLYREKFFPDRGRPWWLGESKPQTPYGNETLDCGGDLAFVTEGESCAWALRAAFPRCPVLGLPGASSWKPGWASLLNRFPIIYLSFDHDEPGLKLLDAVWPFLPWARRVRLPEDADTRDVLQLLGGIKVYERLLADADYLAGAERYLLEMGANRDAA